MGLWPTWSSKLWLTWPSILWPTWSTIETPFRRGKEPEKSHAHYGKLLKITNTWPCH